MRAIFLWVFTYFSAQFGPLFAAETPAISVQLLESELHQRKNRISEFELISQLAAEKGLRIFILGGLASAYAHYVKLDLQREQGDSSLIPSRFNYYWDQIFHSTQDVDIAVARADGSTETENDLNLAVEIVRSVCSEIKVDAYGLNQNFEDKAGLLAQESPWKLQNTDSLSNGVIELTDRNLTIDLKGNEPEPLFLKSLISGEIIYFDEPSHEETKRFKDGLNPKIISVIRLVINASRFNLKIRDSDKNLSELIAAATTQAWNSGQSPSWYVRAWINKNAAKIITHAFDLPTSYHLLNEMPILKELLHQFSFKKSKEVESLWWLLTRQPLESLRRTSLSEARTARELGIQYVAHATPDELSAEQISWNPFGHVNAFKSINGDGQSAVHGEGFYTQLGDFGAFDEAYHIKLEVNPEAKEGVDFKIIPGKQWVLFYNRDSLKIIEDASDNLLVDFHNTYLRSARDPKYRKKAEKLGKRLANLKLSQTDLAVIIGVAQDLVKMNRPLLAVQLLLHFNDTQIRDYLIGLSQEIKTEHPHLKKSLERINNVILNPIKITFFTSGLIATAASSGVVFHSLSYVSGLIFYLIFADKPLDVIDAYSQAMTHHMLTFMMPYTIALGLFGLLFIHSYHFINRVTPEKINILNRLSKIRPGTTSTERNQFDPLCRKLIRDIKKKLIKLTPL